MSDPSGGGASGAPDADDALVDRLRTLAAQVDPPPAHVDELARAAFSTRSLDELARVLFDSADAGDLVRGTADESRVLTLSADGLRLELELAVEDDAVTLRGYVGGVDGTVVVESRDEQRPVTVDEDGWFVATGLPVALLRLRVDLGGGRRVRTPWVSP